MKKIYLIISLFYLQANAQQLPNKVAGKKNEALKDSIKNTEYDDYLPIGGKKATKAGFDLPYSAGLSVNYFWQQSDVLIDNLNIGFNNGAKTNLDGIVKFNKALATASALTVRPDIYLFPFLNVYGILGKSMASTDIGIGVWVPDSTGNEKQISTIDTKVDFQATTFGIGIMPSFGIGNMFMVVDLNIAWTDVPQLNKPAVTTVFAPRLGKNFKFKNPSRKVAVWVGAFRVQLNSGTDGSINLNEVIPPTELAAKLDAAEIQVNDAQQQVDTWWANLTPAEQNKPVNAAKYDRSTQILTRSAEVIDGAQSASANLNNSTVQYTMDKRPKDPWNFVIGAQFQVNKHWMIRAEYGFLGSRTQFMTGLQYRFGL